MIFLSKKKLAEKEKDSIYRMVNLYDDEPEQDMELDLALRIYNDITDVNQSIDWKGFELMMDVYEIENVKDFIEFICIIKEVVSNFDRIYDSKTNTPEVLKAKAFIESLNMNKGR